MHIMMTGKNEEVTTVNDKAKAARKQGWSLCRSQNHNDKLQ